MSINLICGPLGNGLTRPPAPLTASSLPVDLSFPTRSFRHGTAVIARGSKGSEEVMCSAALFPAELDFPRRAHAVTTRAESQQRCASCLGQAYDTGARPVARISAHFQHPNSRAGQPDSTRLPMPSAAANGQTYARLALDPLSTSSCVESRHALAVMRHHGPKTIATGFALKFWQAGVAPGLDVGSLFQRGGA